MGTINTAEVAKKNPSVYIEMVQQKVDLDLAALENSRQLSLLYLETYARENNLSESEKIHLENVIDYKVFTEEAAVKKSLWERIKAAFKRLFDLLFGKGSPKIREEDMNKEVKCKFNVDDVNKICGVTPSTTLNSNYGKALYTKSIYYPTSQSTGKSTSATSRTDVYTYYKYTVSDYLSETTEVYKMLFRDTANSNSIGYWLASRCVLSTPSFSDFDVHFTNSGCVDSYTLGVGLSSSLNQISRGLGVRPIVFLKSNLQTNGKNSSGAWNIIDK